MATLNAVPTIPSGDPPSLDRVRRAIQLEHSMSRREAVRRYPWAIFWSFAMTLTIVMEGYDTALLGSFFAYPSFVEQYGTFESSLGTKSIPASWMVGLENAVSCGELVGLAISGWAMERFGHRKVMIASLVPLCGFIAIQFTSKTLNMLLAGILLVSVPWGVFTVLGTAYSSEICPTVLRPYLTSFTSVAWVIGQLIAAGILSGLVNKPGVWSFRIPFAIQWVWPVPLAVLAWLAPESPWWYIRRSRPDDAIKSMRRLVRHETEEEFLDRVAMMQHTNNYELAMKTQSSYFDCFKGTNLARTEIVCMAYISQGWCGERFAYNATYYFTQAGLGADAAYRLNLGSTGISFVCIFVTWILFKYVGRRTIMLAGLSGLSVSLLLMGTLAFSETPAATWTAGGFALVWISIYSLSIGPVVYTIASEVSATRLRNHTFAVGRTAYVIINIIDKVINPYLINPTELNLKGKTALFWLGTNTIVLIWAIFRLPETKGRTFEELDILFERRIPARHFKGTTVEPVGDTVVEQGDEKNPEDVQVEVKV